MLCGLEISPTSGSLIDFGTSQPSLMCLRGKLLVGTLQTTTQHASSSTHSKMPQDAQGLLRTISTRTKVASMSPALTNPCSQATERLRPTAAKGVRGKMVFKNRFTQTSS